MRTLIWFGKWWLIIGFASLVGIFLILIWDRWRYSKQPDADPKAPGNGDAGTRIPEPANSAANGDGRPS